LNAARWKKPNPADPATQLGRAVLDFYNFRHDRLWVWLAFAVTIAWILLLNFLLRLAFSYLPGQSMLFFLVINLAGCECA